MTSSQTSPTAQATSRDEKMTEEPTQTAIKLEKAMLEVLGRPWTPAGISVESLVYELLEEVKRLRVQAEPSKPHPLSP